MMIKITSACSMGCKHCINDSKPDGQHMSMDMFLKAIRFQQQFGGPFVIISGGEPTEHPDFENIITRCKNRYISYPSQIPLFVTITTNGVWMQNNYDFVKSTYNNRIMWQVTVDSDFYPEQINTSLDVFKLNNVIVCDEVDSIYPMGRAKTNNLPWQAKASSCFNVRAVARQLSDKNALGDCAIRTILMALEGKLHFCTPHIAPNGAIKLGESDLCPVCSWIDKPEHEIFEDILNFECHQCDFINKKLSPKYKRLISKRNKGVS